jgi:hypothetical protein
MVTIVTVFLSQVAQAGPNDSVLSKDFLATEEVALKGEIQLLEQENASLKADLKKGKEAAQEIMWRERYRSYGIDTICKSGGLSGLVARYYDRLKTSWSLPDNEQLWLEKLDRVKRKAEMVGEIDEESVDYAGYYRIKKAGYKNSFPRRHPFKNDMVWLAGITTAVGGMVYLSRHR